MLSMISDIPGNTGYMTNNKEELENNMNEKCLSEAFETLPDNPPPVPEDIHLKVLARRAWEIYNFHKITSYVSISRILHVDIDMVEQLISVGQRLDDKEGQDGH